MSTAARGGTRQRRGRAAAALVPAGLAGPLRRGVRRAADRRHRRAASVGGAHARRRQGRDASRGSATAGLTGFPARPAPPTAVAGAGGRASLGVARLPRRGLPGRRRGPVVAAHDRLAVGRTSGGQHRRRRRASPPSVTSAAMLALLALAVLAALPVWPTRSRVNLRPRRLIVPAAVLVSGGRAAVRRRPAISATAGRAPAATAACVPGRARRVRVGHVAVGLAPTGRTPARSPCSRPPELAWMAVSPVALAAAVLAAATLVRRAELPPRLLAFETRLGIAACAVMAVFLGGLRLLGRDRRPAKPLPRRPDRRRRDRGHGAGARAGAAGGASGPVPPRSRGTLTPDGPHFRSHCPERPPASLHPRRSRLGGGRRGGGRRRRRTGLPRRAAGQGRCSTRLDGACSVTVPDRTSYAAPGPSVSGTFYSAARRRTVGYTIAYPPGHRPGDRLPLVVMLHGFGADHTDALSGMSPAQAVALRARRRAAATDGHGHGGRRRRLLEPAPGRRPEAMLTDELIPMCQRARPGRRAAPDRRHRHLDGRLRCHAARREVPAPGRRGRRDHPGDLDELRAGAGRPTRARTRPPPTSRPTTRSPTPPRWRASPVRVAAGYADPFYPGVRALAGALPAGAVVDFGGGCHDGAFFTAQEPPSLAFLARHLSAAPLPL